MADFSDIHDFTDYVLIYYLNTDSAMFNPEMLSFDFTNYECL